MALIHRNLELTSPYYGKNHSLNLSFVTEREDDCDKAIRLWSKLQDADFTPSQKFARNLYSMAKANNKSIPLDLVALLDKQKAANP